MDKNWKPIYVACKKLTLPWKTENQHVQSEWVEWFMQMETERKEEQQPY